MVDSIGYWRYQFRGVLRAGAANETCAKQIAMSEEEILEIAKRGEIDPESLTLDEIRELGLYVLAQTGEPIEPQIESLN